jgi:hypothetical protein
LSSEERAVQEIEMRHEIGCDPDTYWEKCVLSDDYNKSLFLEGLKFPRYRLLEQKDQGNTVFRKVEVEPLLVGLPGPVKKVIGDSLSYVEEGTYDRTTKRYRFTSTPNGSLKGKATTSGEMYCEKVGDKQCVRVSKLRVEVKVFMVGGLVEDRLVGDLKTSYAKAAEFTTRYVKEKGY